MSVAPFPKKIAKLFFLFFFFARGFSERCKAVAPSLTRVSLDAFYAEVNCMVPSVSQHKMVSIKDITATPIAITRRSFGLAGDAAGVRGVVTRDAEAWP